MMTNGSPVWLVLAGMVLMAGSVQRIACAEPPADEARGHYAPINGLRMYYEIHGQGRPLVLIHGGGSTIETSFGTVLPALAKSRQVIALELQGHGRTADIDRPLTFEQDADDVASLLRHLGIEKADFYGYSNGGTTALRIAQRHPHLVRRLVIASAFVNTAGLQPGVHESFNRPATPDDMPPELREAFERVAPRPQDLPAIINKLVARMRDFQDWRSEDLRSIEAPTLIIVGDADVIRPEHAVEMFRLLPQAQLAVLPGTDHMAIVKRTDLLLALIPPFLDAPSPAVDGQASR